MPGPGPHHGLCVWVTEHTGSLGLSPPLPFFVEILLLQTHSGMWRSAGSFPGSDVALTTHFHQARRRKTVLLGPVFFMLLLPSGD